MLCLALTGCATWTPTEQVTFALNLGVNATDFALTAHGLDEGYTEANPLLTNSKDSVAVAKIVNAAFVYFLCNQYDERISVPLSLLLTAPSAYAVVNNLIVMDD